MENFHNKLTVFFFLALIFPYFGLAQISSSNELSFEVNRIHPPGSVSREKLDKAQTLADLNKWYRPSWVSEYISVEILASHKGSIKKALSENDTLTHEQKDIINWAGAGTDISVEVRYIPENNLTQNEPKVFDFTFTVDPEKEAKYPGGQQQLKQYLKEKAIDKIPEGSFKNYDLTAIQFTINEEGKIIDAHVFDAVYQAHKYKETNELLMEAIRDMPCWEPAEYANGTKTKQEFVLTVGNMENCIVNLLNISQD